jgi:toxin ParE1/3/4
VVKWRRDAANDLKRLRMRIARDNPVAARDVALRIRQAIRLLEKQPGMGRAGRVVGTREWVGVPPYVLVYRVVDGALEIVRVLHGAQKWPPDSDAQ